jgi:hypothetical protein
MVTGEMRVDIDEAFSKSMDAIFHNGGMVMDIVY